MWPPSSRDDTLSGGFRGGYCILRTRDLLVNRRLSRAKGSVLAIAMHEIGLGDMYLKPRAGVQSKTKSQRSPAARTNNRTPDHDQSAHIRPRQHACHFNHEAFPRVEPAINP